MAEDISRRLVQVEHFVRQARRRQLAGSSASLLSPDQDPVWLEDMPLPVLVSTGTQADDTGTHDDQQLLSPVSNAAASMADVLPSQHTIVSEVELAQIEMAAVAAGEAPAAAAATGRMPYGSGFSTPPAQQGTALIPEDAAALSEEHQHDQDSQSPLNINISGSDAPASTSGVPPDAAVTFIIPSSPRDSTLLQKAKNRPNPGYSGRRSNRLAQTSAARHDREHQYSSSMPAQQRVPAGGILPSRESSRAAALPLPGHSAGPPAVPSQGSSGGAASRAKLVAQRCATAPAALDALQNCISPHQARTIVQQTDAHAGDAARSGPGQGKPTVLSAEAHAEGAARVGPRHSSATILPAKDQAGDEAHSSGSSGRTSSPTGLQASLAVQGAGPPEASEPMCQDPVPWRPASKRRQRAHWSRPLSEPRMYIAPADPVNALLHAVHGAHVGQVATDSGASQAAPAGQLGLQRPDVLTLDNDSSPSTRPGTSESFRPRTSGQAHAEGPRKPCRPLTPELQHDLWPGAGAVSRQRLSREGSASRAWNIRNSSVQPTGRFHALPALQALARPSSRSGVSGQGSPHLQASVEQQTIKAGDRMQVMGFRPGS